MAPQLRSLYCQQSNKYGRCLWAAFVPVQGAPHPCLLSSLPVCSSAPLLSPAANMAKHHPDLIMCRKQPGIAIGRLCEKCDGKCVICDSYVRPSTLVRICDECESQKRRAACM